jgi:hypothetical protein
VRGKRPEKPERRPAPLRELAAWARKRRATIRTVAGADDTQTSQNSIEKCKFSEKYGFLSRKSGFFAKKCQNFRFI